MTVPAVHLQGCGLGPGTYDYKSLADEVINKQTGNRGPYDTFTIDRNKPIMTGHYAKDVSTATYFNKSLVTGWFLDVLFTTCVCLSGEQQPRPRPVHQHEDIVY